MLKTKIKANSITNLTDARYFAAREVEWLGFRLEPGADNSISVVAANAIAGWVDGVKIVGEFEFATPVEIRELAAKINLDAIQLGMFVAPEAAKELPGVPIFREIVVERGSVPAILWERVEELAPWCEVFLLNFQKQGITWDDLKKDEPLRNLVKDLCGKHKVILGIEADSSGLPGLVNTLHPYGLSLIGGAEEQTGVKSFDELDDILDALESLSPKS
jgi:phosphoribosylanthranilate isomerase